MAQTTKRKKLTPQEKIQRAQSFWQGNPEDYLYKRLGIKTIWEAQKEMCQWLPDAIKNHRKMVIASGHSLGKDYLCAAWVLYFLEVWGPCIVITTAPTDRQVKKIMWGEIEGHVLRAPYEFPGTILTQEIKMGPDWYALGFTTKETGNMIGKFQGFHSPRVFVIASEAQAIPDPIYEQIDAILTGEVGLLIEIGNPLRASGQFARDIRDTDNIVIQMSCLDNPNYIEKKTVIPGLASYEWVESKRRLWGEDDPRWYGRVLGQIPLSSIDNIFPQELIDQGKLTQTKYVQLYAGTAVDVAGLGDDENVIYAGENGMIKTSEIKANCRPAELASRTSAANGGVNGNFIVVDCDGIGIGAYQELVHLQNKGLLPDVNIVKFHGSGATNENTDVKPEYHNMRALAWFTAQKMVKEGKASIPDDQYLIEELMEVKFFENKKGLIQLEEKEDIKERLGRSPDRADAWVMLMYGFSQAEPTKRKDAYAEDYSETEFADERSRSWMVA